MNHIVKNAQHLDKGGAITSSGARVAIHTQQQSVSAGDMMWLTVI